MTPYQKHVAKWKNCNQCELSNQRNKVVLCRGRIPSPILFIGEAPGQSEDVFGKPFFGPAGRLLDQIIDRSLDGQYDYALTNLVACFPKERKRRGINEPSEEHIEACVPRLQEFVNLCQPRLIVNVGKLARKYIYGAAQFRNDNKPEQPAWVSLGKWLEFAEIIHPAAILRMDVSQRDLAAKRCIVTIEDAVAKL